MNRYFFPFPGETAPGRIKLRYQRFLADIVLEDGSEIIAHVPNSGNMTNCWEPGARVVVTKHTALKPEKNRKLAYTLQAVEMPDGWVSVNTMNPNKAVAAAITEGCIAGFEGYEFLQTEIKSSCGSRFDLALFRPNYGMWSDQLSFKPERATQLRRAESSSPTFPAVIEIKNATMRSDDGVLFPDAKTERGRKHLRHLLELKEAGLRAVILFFAGRSSARWVGPAEIIDPEYAALLKTVVEKGVEAMAVRVKVSEKGLMLDGLLPIMLGSG